MAELTEQHKFEIQESWKAVKQSMRKHSMEFFVCFFKRYPQHQKMFKDFRDVSINDLPHVQKFRGHAVRVFFAVSSLVDNLDDLDAVVAILQTTVRDHKPRGITVHHYEDVFETILYYLGKALGDAFTACCKESWQAVSQLIMSVIRAELESDLPAEMKKLVAASWAPVKKNMRKHSVDFFVFFFETNPEYMTLFRDFKGMNLADLPMEKKFRGHALRVFFAVTSLVDNLDALDIVTDVLQKTVRDHYPRGIRSSHYQNLFSAVLAFLEKTLGSLFDSKTKDAWATTAKLMLTVINAELDKIEITNGIEKTTV